MLGGGIAVDSGDEDAEQKHGEEEVKDVDTAEGSGEFEPSSPFPYHAFEWDESYVQHGGACLCVLLCVCISLHLICGRNPTRGATPTPSACC